MTIVEVREERDLASLRDRWDALLKTSYSNSIFLTWEWMSAWWTAYGMPGELRIMLVHDDSGALIGIAPLRSAITKRYGRSYRTLRLIGDGSADSDYLDFIIAAGQERQVLEALWAYWTPEMDAGTLIEVNEIPADSRTVQILKEVGAATSVVWAESSVPCSVVQLPGNWEEYLKSLAPRFRTKIRSVLREFEARSKEIRFEFCTRTEELPQLLSALYDLHTRRWAKDYKPGVFGWEKKRQFYDILSPLLLERQWLRFSFVEWKGRVIACQYGFEFQERYFQLQEGYEPRSEHWNPGAGLRAWSIRWFIENGVREYDFLGGVGRHKADWAATTKLSKCLTFGKATAANTLYCHGPEWSVRVRHTVKGLIPQRWIDARAARQKELRQVAFTRHSELDGDWKRRLVFASYYYSGVSHLLRPLRNRYLLRPSGGLRLERRTRPSIRIVYYHRVNNNNDPFFPAMTPSKFEQEIGFLARNYAIISMADAVKRLADGGPAGPAVVVTFDDGYADNYRIAYPILERYKIPATIFLTTGAIDSSSPLWFERLALAIKQSPLSSVDLELDVPRRFALGTQEQRLWTNGEIYGFLRYRPDAERQLRLNEIIHRLGGCDDSVRSGAMLNWDEIRKLHCRGIDFGGHTVTHPFVSRLSRDQALWEATECKRRIEDELQAPIEYFAYPSGREMDFSPWNKEILQEAGYRAAVSTLWGINHPETDRMELRRGQPWESGCAGFAAKFDWYQWTDV